MIESSRSSAATVSAETAFPFKLHIILDESEKQGFDDVISWQGNNAFMVHKPKKFEDSIMKEYFNQTLYRNFQKQLEIHGFKRLAVGEPYGGSYTHSLFLRGNPNMGRFMIKSPLSKKSKLRRGSSDPISQLQAQAQPKKFYHGRGLSEVSDRTSPPPLTSMTRRNTTITPSFPQDALQLSIEEDFEPLPHHEERVPRIMEYCEHERRSTKKHRTNSSWSPIHSVRDDSAAVTDWMPTAFGGTETITDE